MRLDDMSLARARARGLDHIRVDRPLRKELNTRQLVGFLVKYLDEGAPDDLALLFRVGHARERRQESLLGIDTDDTHAKMLGESAHHLVAFAETKQTVIHEDTDQLIADRTMQERGHDGRVDTA